MTRNEKQARARQALSDVAAEVAALAHMTTAELAARYAEVFGEPTRSRNKAYLQKKVAWRIQELAEGGLSARARGRIEALAEDTPIRRHAPRTPRAQGEPATTRTDSPTAPTPAARDPRLPAAAATLTKTYQGTEHRVLVLDDAFEYQGERYTSLSKIAKVITGTTWNGFLFFGLAQRKTAPKAAR
ncbi:MAG: DUF2924 domain-containing protein [Myxococcales bacterium]|nr:DUF2924 domain-containing protein [Myxococcales bacterium]